MKNIDKFNYFTGRLFADLYEVFPNPMTVTGSIYLADIIEKEDEAGAFGYNEFTGNTLNWLARSDYIDMNVQGYIGQPTEYEIVLSEKGLETMKVVPDALSTNESFGELLQKSAKKKAIDKVVDVAGKALSYGVSVVSDIS